MVEGMSGGAPRLPGTYSQEYIKNSQVNVQALPDQDKEFKGWRNELQDLMSTNLSYVVDMSHERIIYADFG